MPLADTTNRRPILLGLAASAALTVLVVAGSRNLEHYDPALFGYTVASVVAFGALVYRYAVWLRRPATRVYRASVTVRSSFSTGGLDGRDDVHRPAAVHRLPLVRGRLPRVQDAQGLLDDLRGLHRPLGDDGDDAHGLHALQ